MEQHAFQMRPDGPFGERRSSDKAGRRRRFRNMPSIEVAADYKKSSVARGVGNLTGIYERVADLPNNSRAVSTRFACNSSTVVSPRQTKLTPFQCTPLYCCAVPNQSLSVSDRSTV